MVFYDVYLKIIFLTMHLLIKQEAKNIYIVEKKTCEKQYLNCLYIAAKVVKRILKEH